MNNSKSLQCFSRLLSTQHLQLLCYDAAPAESDRHQPGLTDNLSPEQKAEIAATAIRLKTGIDLNEIGDEDFEATKMELLAAYTDEMGVLLESAERGMAERIAKLGISVDFTQPDTVGVFINYAKFKQTLASEYSTGLDKIFAVTDDVELQRDADGTPRYVEYFYQMSQRLDGARDEVRGLFAQDIESTVRTILEHAEGALNEETQGLEALESALSSTSGVPELQELHQRAKSFEFDNPAAQPEELLKAANLYGLLLASGDVVYEKWGREGLERIRSTYLPLQLDGKRPEMDVVLDKALEILNRSNAKPALQAFRGEFEKLARTVHAGRAAPATEGGEATEDSKQKWDRSLAEKMVGYQNPRGKILDKILSGAPMSEAETKTAFYKATVEALRETNQAIQATADFSQAMMAYFGLNVSSSPDTLAVLLETEKLTTRAEHFLGAGVGDLFSATIDLQKTLTSGRSGDEYLTSLERYKETVAQFANGGFRTILTIGAALQNASGDLLNFSSEEKAELRGAILSGPEQGLKQATDIFIGSLQRRGKADEARLVEGFVRIIREAGEAAESIDKIKF